MLYIVSKGNTNEWYVHGKTTLQASHRNGSTRTPPLAIWPKIIPMGNLNGCHAVTTLPYNCRGVPNALSRVK
jgi:hypothetical protein